MQWNSAFIECQSQAFNTEQTLAPHCLPFTFHHVNAYKNREKTNLFRKLVNKIYVYILTSGGCYVLPFSCVFYFALGNFLFFPTLFQDQCICHILKKNLSENINYIG